MTDKETLEKLVALYYRLIEDRAGFEVDVFQEYNLDQSAYCTYEVDIYDGENERDYIKNKFKEILDAETEG